MTLVSCRAELSRNLHVAFSGALESRQLGTRRRFVDEAVGLLARDPAPPEAIWGLLIRKYTQDAEEVARLMGVVSEVSEVSLPIQHGIPEPDMTPLCSAYRAIPLRGRSPNGRL
jgi:hypothetical protein